MAKQRKTTKHFTECMAQYLHLKIDYYRENGTLEKLVKPFLDGDQLEICIRLDFTANDIIFDHLLCSQEITPDVLKKVKKLWDQEK
jgi:hypothetical protein